MDYLKKYIFLLLGMIISCTYVHAESSFTAPKDSATAEACRQIALKLDWLSRYQDREACTKNLDGLQVYIASQHILNRKYNDAKTLLITATYQINFAIDINCYGQDDMKSAIKSLNEIIDTL